MADFKKLVDADALMRSVEDACLPIGATTNLRYILNEASDASEPLRQTINGLTESLSLFERSAVPCSFEINSKGYNWCLSYLDQALQYVRYQSADKYAKDLEDRAVLYLAKDCGWHVGRYGLRDIWRVANVKDDGTYWFEDIDPVKEAKAIGWKP